MARGSIIDLDLERAAAVAWSRPRTLETFVAKDRRPADACESPTHRARKAPTFVPIRRGSSAGASIQFRTLVSAFRWLALEHHRHLRCRKSSLMRVCSSPRRRRVTRRDSARQATGGIRARPFLGLRSRYRQEAGALPDPAAPCSAAQATTSRVAPRGICRLSEPSKNHAVDQTTIGKTSARDATYVKFLKKSEAFRAGASGRSAVISRRVSHSTPMADAARMCG